MPLLRTVLSIGVTALVLFGGWQLLVTATGVAPYILPGPARVLQTWWRQLDLIAGHAATTALEIVLGLVIGTLLGGLAALTINARPVVGRRLLPLLVITQAVPVFAIAPLLMLWLGYGMASKVAMATLIIFFPVTVAFHDGLRRTEPGWLDLATTMTAGQAKARRAIIRHIQIPAALPALASGLRVATATAPIGAVVGEWVGSSSGLGYLMLHANARLQTDLTFAALFTLAVITLALYFAMDRALRRLIPWQPDTLRSNGKD